MNIKKQNFNLSNLSVPQNHHLVQAKQGTMKWTTLIVLSIFLLAVTLNGSRMKKDWWLAKGTEPNAGTERPETPVIKEEEKPVSPGFISYYWSRFAEWWWPVKVEGEQDGRLSLSEDESAKEISFSKSSEEEQPLGDRKMSYRNALDIDEDHSKEGNADGTSEDPFERQTEANPPTLDGIIEDQRQDGSDGLSTFDLTQ